MTAPQVHEAIPEWGDGSWPEMVAALPASGPPREASQQACVVTVELPGGRRIVAAGQLCDTIAWVETEDVTGPDDTWRRSRPVARHLRVQLTGLSEYATEEAR